MLIEPEEKAAFRSIDDLIQRMEELQAELDSAGDPKRHFHATYRRTTVAIRDEIRSGGFADAGWMERWDVAFAGLYLTALEGWMASRECSDPWRIAFQTAEERHDLPALRHVLLGMNAHINFDLPQALLLVITDEDFRDPELLKRRQADHAHVDVVLMRQVSTEDAAISAAQGGKSLLDKLKDPLERWASGHMMHEARSKVWANVLVMQAARASGDEGGLERLRAELSQRAADKLAQLVEAHEVLLQLAVSGFGVLLPGAQIPHAR